MMITYLFVRVRGARMDGVPTPGVPIRTIMRIGVCERKQTVGDDNRNYLGTALR